MNRLSVRLTVAFIGVTLVAVLTVALLVSWNSGRDFRRYLARREAVAQSDLPGELAAYYQQNGDWHNVAGVLNRPPSGGGMGRGMGMNRPTTLLADGDRHIIFDSRGTRTGDLLQDDELHDTVPIVQAGRTVGYLLLMPGHTAGMIAPADQEFLDELRSTLALAALIAGGLGVILALVISRTIAAPLHGLAKAARGLAARQWEQRVPVRGAAEIAQVAGAFNAMADELQRAETLRRNLMADIAHELRTPLTVMQGSLRALLDGVYPLELKEIASIYDETRLLSRLVGDLRELALADAGQLPLKLQPIAVLPILRTVVEQFALAAEAQGTRVQLVETPSLPNVCADPDRLTQVLHNLLANALRHDPDGTITITTTRLPGQVRLSVQDIGEGIAAEDLPYIFDRFYRADESRARHNGGAGLGLAIAKAWVEAMRGQIGVESQPGQGSTFWFTLPAA